MAKTKVVASDAVKARVLMACAIDGVSYAVDDVVALSPEVAAAHADIGNIDVNTEAVAHCVTELGKSVITHAGRVVDVSAENQAG